MQTPSSPESSADPRPTARQALRSGTAVAHERLDALFGGFDLAERDGYAAFLAAHAGALAGVEAALDAAGMDRLIDDWPTRRRADLIRADLAALGHDMPAPQPVAPIAGAAEAWGAAYVLEGSRLGGAMLARGVGGNLPKTYLATPLAPGAWRKLLAMLDEALYPDAMRAPAIRSALAVFALFEASGRAALAR